MSTLSQFFSSSGGPHTSNPKQLTRIAVPAANIVVRQQTTETAANVAGFFTACTAQLDTDWVADTYKTLLSISSGSGFVSAIIGPGAPSSSFMTTTFRIEVDGVTVDIPVGFSVNTNTRPCLGRFRHKSASATDPRDILSDLNTAAANVPATLQIGSTLLAMALTPFQCISSGIGMLRYERSLSVQIKTSSAQTTTTNVDRRCGIFYTAE